MPTDEITIKYGPWAPDLQNVPAPLTDGVNTVPCADVLNVYYQDGAYRCLPTLNPIGLGLPAPCLNAFTYYDNVAGQELVFSGTATALYAVDQSVVPVPIETTVTVFGTGVSIGMILAGSIKAQPVFLGLTLAGGTATGGFLYHGTLKAGTSGTAKGFSSGFFGTLSPASTYQGNPIAAFYTSGGNTTLQINGGNFGQGYFATLTIPTLNATIRSSTATYSSASPLGRTYSQWVWPFSVGFVAGSSYTVNLNA